ncbi:glycosyltransferase family 4 protein [Flavobacteriales bacterium]|nr:glycosyltransferase family 4 protein [Flavobacteriales bacterium]
MHSIDWLFRKKRTLGNFSIEQSFREVSKAWPKLPTPAWTEATHFSEGWLNRWKIIRQASKFKTDILHITGDINFAALAWPKWRRNRPRVMLTIHDIGFIHEHKGWKRWVLKKFWVTWPLSCVDQLITVSEATKESVLREAPWFSPERITVIPTVVPQHFHLRKVEPQNSKPIALHVGLAENKNLRRHAEALQGLGIHLRIIGKPSEADELLLKQLNIEYSAQSRLTDLEMQEAYATSDFLLFASTLEGFGMPIIEAQMVGLPVITSNIDPMREVAGAGALLCSPLQSESIRHVILQLTQNDFLRKQLIESGHQNHKRYSPDQVAVELSTLYSNMFN